MLAYCSYSSDFDNIFWFAGKPLCVTTKVLDQPYPTTPALPSLIPLQL